NRSPRTSSSCSPCWRAPPAVSCHAISSWTRSRARPTKPSIARSTSTSPSCAASSSPTPKSRAISRPCAAPATCSRGTPTDVARLHSRIYLHFLGVLLVVAVTTGVVFALGAREAFRREMAPRVTRHLASLVGERIGDPAALTARLQQMHDDLHLAVRVRDL